MFEFDYSVSLRVLHPTLDPSEVSQALRLAPMGSHRAGERRKAPGGTPLAGIYEETYWYCDLPHPDGMRLSDFLESVARRFDMHRSFFQNVHETGGSVEIFVGWFSGRNSADKFVWALLAHMGSLFIDLSLDVYAPDS